MFSRATTGRAEGVLVTLFALGTNVVLAGCSESAATTIDTDAGMLDAASTPVSDGGTDDGGMRETSRSEPGSACSCDDECEGDSTHPGICVFGICMTRASATCASAGSSAECPMGSRCWGVADRSESICWPDCAAHECAGTCDGDGSCVAGDDDGCDPACGSICGAAACSAEAPDGVCERADQACVEGTCVDACSPTAPDGYCPSGHACEGGACVSATGCPSWMCSGPTCAQLELLPGSADPASASARTMGYYRSSPDRYSYLRRDLVLLLQYAVCEVGARFPGTTPLATGDLSQMDALTPGTDRGSPRHPTSTHTGNDLDLAYYQTDGANDYHIVCGDGSDTNGNGTAGRYNDGYFCTTETNTVDIPREAYFFAMMASSPLARVFGVDTTFADDLTAELRRLRDAGEISAEQYARATSLGHGAEGGWQFHHHHSHMSYRR